jgi:organic radical activating enzyme
MKADELKVIISSQKDIKWAEDNAQKVKSTCKLYLQPEWSAYNEIVPTLVDYAMANPKWQVSLQAHKFMKIP